jgi:hypothetical protein
MRIALYNNYYNLIFMDANDGLREWQKHRDQAAITSLYFHECYKYRW